LEGEVGVLFGGFAEGLLVQVRADVEAVKLTEGGREGGRGESIIFLQLLSPGGMEGERKGRREGRREGGKGGPYLVLLGLDAEVEVVIGVVELGAFARLGVKGLFAGADDVTDFLG